MLKQLKEACKSQAPSTSTPSTTVMRPKAAPYETPSLELSMPSFSDIIPEEWLQLTDIAFEKSPSQQPHQQVTTETTSDTGTEHPIVAKKAPRKFFPQNLPVEEEEEEEEAVPPTPPPLQQHHQLEKAPELVKMAGEDSSFPENVALTYMAVKQMYHPMLRRLLQPDQFHLHTNFPLEKTDKQSSS